MPGADGVTLAKMVRQENEAVQIVFITGYSDYIAEATMWPRSITDEAGPPESSVPCLTARGRSTAGTSAA